MKWKQWSLSCHVFFYVWLVKHPLGQTVGANKDAYQANLKMPTQQKLSQQRFIKVKVKVTLLQVLWLNAST